MAEQHYLALYRKYRPRTFEDVRGREVIVRTLKNQILSGRIAHSYLFCGTRGTGKTTIAKIFAKAVNCENPQDGSPCGECPSCRAIGADASLNVVEMDAASNNGVDDIRNIIDQVAYSPTQGKYRVYIIDEVHMLSTAAFNALLKTLEEPPSYAIFILATTEPNTLPVTILSRCQRYDYGRLSTETIEGRLREVADAEQLKAEDKALRYIASAADGSMRDGLSLLDQCNAFNYGNETLTYEKTLEILGAVDTRVFSKLYGHIHEGQVAEALGVLEDVLMQGREMMQFVADFLWYLRNLMLLSASESTKDSLDISADNLAQMIEDARKSEMSEIMREIRIFSSLVEQIRYSASRRILTEMAIIRAARGRMGGSDAGAEDQLDTLRNRIRELEQRLLEDEKKIAERPAASSWGEPADGGSAGSGGAIGGQAGGAPGAPGQNAAQQKPSVKKQYPKAVPEDVKDIVRNWTKYISKLPPGMTRVSLLAAKHSVGDHGQLVIVFNNYVTADHFLHDEGYRNRLRYFLRQCSGKDVEIEYKALDKGQKFTDNYVDLSDLVKMEIEEE
ncbi:MAG: DNA polymerase III subunit gamma/tau [Lachnospiraceae bacterium]|nr:DNA polymerase III subunit gamma/tau [Lachnospiraceae bacterium]